MVRNARHHGRRYISSKLFGGRPLHVEPLEARLLLASDFGDAPDPIYNTLSTNNGPSHTVPVVPLIYMGASVDMEAEALQSANANGYDVDGALPDDEDGLNHPLADLTLTGEKTNVFIQGGAPTLRGLLFDGLGTPHNGNFADNGGISGTPANPFRTSLDMALSSPTIVGNTFDGGGDVGLNPAAKALIEGNSFMNRASIYLANL